MNDKPAIGKIEFGPRPDHYGLLSRIRRLENKIPKVFICIRLRPKSQEPEIAKKEFERNLHRAKTVARYAVLNNCDPEATTIYFTQFLNDFSLVERDLGIKIGQVRLYNCNELWDIRDEGEEPSSGMKSDIEYALKNNIPVKRINYADIVNWLDHYDNPIRDCHCKPK